uniref:Replicative DNA helicase n=1 Tax=uncultured marine virus TaxID=186617 RepID=A0A0F7L553_9VIRU|nr:replicative DNA helicase [uncultured marine virus]
MSRRSESIGRLLLRSSTLRFNWLRMMVPMSSSRASRLSPRLMSPMASCRLRPFSKPIRPR